MSNKDIYAIVGMSGGVDSFVTAYVLKEQGYDVISILMKNWDDTDENGIYTATEDYDDATEVYNQIGIPYYAVNFGKEYRNKVFVYFLDEYKKDRTPDSDTMCNKEIRFKAPLDHAMNLGADYATTGHYTRIYRHKDGHVEMLRGTYNNKGQTYFLNQLPQQQSSEVMLPVGDIKKSGAHRIAGEQGLVTAKRKDSTGIYFISGKNFKTFLPQYLPAQPGDVITLDGKKMGKHSGLTYYTIGQRHGLGISGDGDPWFVIGKNLKDNVLYVERRFHHDALYSDYSIASDYPFVNPEDNDLDQGFEYTAKLRCRQEDTKVSVRRENDHALHITFAEPVRTITSGQTVVSYQDDMCLGGTAINDVFKSEGQLSYVV